MYHSKRIVDQIEIIKERLNEIRYKKVSKEDAWDFEQIDPDIISTIYLLKLLRYHNNKDEYKEIIDKIKEQTFSKLKENEIDFNEESEFFRVLDFLFKDSMRDNHKINILDFNYLSAILIINLYYRQCIRFNETGKKPDDENNIWDISIINLADIPNNSMLKKLIEETKIIHDNMSVSIRKK